MIPVGVSLNLDRPDRLDVDKVKYPKGKDDPQYSIDNSNYCLSSWYLSQVYPIFLSNVKINRSFYNGNQWIFNEDLEAFLVDDSRQNRNRSKIVRNFISSNVNYYVGTASKFDFTFYVRSISEKAINRREQKLSEMLTWTDIAKTSAELGDTGFDEYLRQEMPIGAEQQDTKDIFENVWVDEYETNMNYLLAYVAKENGFQKKQGELATDMALSGLGVLKYIVYNGEFRFKKILPERFIFDTTATEYDLSDSEFMGEIDYMLPSEIYEEARNLTDDERKEIESFAKSFGDSRVPIQRICWKDNEVYTYGYVMDEFGYQRLERINHIESGNSPKYTDKDLVPLKDLNDTQKRILKGNNKSNLYVDIIRFCYYVPKEIVPYPERTGFHSDIVLDHGILPYQDTEYQKFSSCKFPYKVYCWLLDNGLPGTPVTQLINPQRMINRLSSVSESITQTAMPPSMAYDGDLIDKQGGEEELLRSRYQGKPIKLNSRGRGIHNAITTVGSTLDGSISFYENMIASYKSTMDVIIGVNEALRGESVSSDQLVGVTAMQIQRATVIQEPFFKAMAQIYEQCYQAISNVGKRVYIQNQYKIPIIMGDQGAKMITFSSDYEIEDFRAFITKEPEYQLQVQTANTIMLQMVQLGLLDKDTYADSYGRITVDQIGQKLRKSLKQSNYIASQQSQVQQEKEVMALQAAQNQSQQQMALEQQQRVDEMANAQADRQNKVVTSAIKSRAGRRNI